MESNTNRKTITRTFAAEGGVERTISYRLNSEGLHTVKSYLSAGEDIAPDYWAFKSIEQARFHWKLVVASWRKAGFIPAEQFWAALRAEVAASKAHKA